MIKTLNDNASRVGEMHSRSLNNMDDAAAQRNASQLDELMQETSALSNQLKRRIKALEAQPSSGRDAQIRRQQVRFTMVLCIRDSYVAQTGLVKTKFMEAIQNYQQVEQQYRTKYKQRMERQYKIVKPDATPEEIRAVVNDTSNDQIFSQAVCVFLG
jgi:syntaxin 1B/2/3